MNSGVTLDRSLASLQFSNVENADANKAKRFFSVRVLRQPLDNTRRPRMSDARVCFDHEDI